MPSLDTIITRYISEGFPRTLNEFRQLADASQTAEQRLDRFSTNMLGFGAAGAGAMAVVGGASLKAYGQIQMAEIAFSKSLGGIDKARSKIEELRVLDRQSPFSFQETVKSSARLQAVGFKAEELVGTLRDIGDVTGGTMGTTDDFMGIGRAIGQMRSKGKVSMEEINQLADRNVPALQILQKQLKLTDDQLAQLMAGDMTIKADEAIPALLKGFRELYGGSMLEASKTFPGQVSNLQSAVEQLGAAIGEVAANSNAVGPTIENLTQLTDSTREFIKENPGLVKMALALGGVTVAATLLAGVGLKVRGIWREVFGIIDGGIKGKKALAAATMLDNVAERKKIVTAGLEGRAIGGVTDAALAGAGAKTKLAGATATAAVASQKLARIDNARLVASKELSRAMVSLNKAKPGSDAATAALQRVDAARKARAALGVASAEARAAITAAEVAAAGVKPVGLLGRITGRAGAIGGAVQGVAGRNLFQLPAARYTGPSFVPSTAKAFRIPKGMMGAGQFMSSSSWNAAKASAALNGAGAPAANATLLSRLGLAGKSISIGGGALAGAGGILGGMQAYDDYQKIGMSQGKAVATGIGIGLGETLISLFVPGGAIAVGIAEAAKWVIDENVNKPMEREATQNLGTRQSENDARNFSKMTHKERSDRRLEESRALNEEAETWENQIGTWTPKTDEWAAKGIRAEAENKRLQALSEMRRQRRQSREDQEAFDTGMRRNPQTGQMEMTKEYSDRLNAIPRSKYEPNPELGTVTNQRNGETKVTFRIPERDSDRSYQKLRQANLTASPNYAS